jgi:hypothetical protein
MAEKKELPDIDASPAETALELAKARARIAELEAAASSRPSFAITSATELFAGKDENGTDWWYYKIDLPPSGGIDIKINGISYYHGEQYKIDTNTLRDLKDKVFRCWKHEGDIKGNNENFYRRPTEVVMRGGGR